MLTAVLDGPALSLPSEPPSCSSATALRDGGFCRSEAPTSEHSVAWFPFTDSRPLRAFQSRSEIVSRILVT